MLYRTMPKSKDKISILGFGCMRFPGSMTNPDELKSIELIRSSIEKGVNYFDTAWPVPCREKRGHTRKGLKKRFQRESHDCRQTSFLAMQNKGRYGLFPERTA